METSSFSPTTARELTVFIQNTFQQLQDKLNKTEDAIVTRFNTTSKIIDQIEKSLVELMDHAGVNEPYDDEESESELLETYKDENEWRIWTDRRTNLTRAFKRLPREPSSVGWNPAEITCYSLIDLAFWDVLTFIAERDNLLKNSRNLSTVCQLHLQFLRGLIRLFLVFT